MTYKITERIISLVTDLINQGYEGDARITNSYCTGTRSHLGSDMSVELSGFCKESLYLAEDDNGNIVFVGRYSVEREAPDASVDDIVSCAWGVYQSYKARGYSMPYEFEDLFKKYGYIVLKSETSTKWVEAQPAPKEAP